MRRPYYDVVHSRSLISDLEPETTNFEVSKNWFLISFTYPVKIDNDRFVKTIQAAWFEFEQPFLCFFKSLNDFEKCRSESNHDDLLWSQIVELSECYVVFRSAQEEVMWIGKSRTRPRFEDILQPHN